MKQKLRHIAVELLDSCWREPRFILKHYIPMFRGKNTQQDRYIFMVDGRMGHGGMFDRLKGLITVYAIARSHGKNFFLHFNYPFRLEKYLEPNKYDWRIDDKDITYSYPSSKPVIAYGELKQPRRLLKNRKGDTHFYYGADSLWYLNKRIGLELDWGTMYRELFKPTAYLQKYIDYYKEDIGKDYVVFHTRFLNLLGDKVETAVNPELDDERKIELKNICKDKIKELAGDNKVMIASDSMNFIEFIKEEIPNVYVVPGTVKHVDTAGETNDAENIKMFLDYYLISNATKVYNLVGPGMWKSAFPEYAAKIGNVPFERIML